NEDAIEEMKLHLENEKDYANKDEFLSFISNVLSYVNHYKESEIEDFRQSIYTCGYVSYEKIMPKFNIQNLRFKNIELTDEDFNAIFMINSKKVQYSDNLLIGIYKQFGAWEILDPSYGNWRQFAMDIIKSRFEYLCRANNEYNV